MEDLIMLEIIRQYEDTREGNDCLIKDCIVWMKCHEQYIVVNIRRYIGWCDHGISFRSQKEFDDANDACDYYWDMINNRSKY